MTPFFLQTEVFTKDPLLFIDLTKWPPIFLLSSLKDPLFSLFSLSPKDPYFGGRVRTSPSLPYVSALPGWRQFDLMVVVRANQYISYMCLCAHSARLLLSVCQFWYNIQYTLMSLSNWDLNGRYSQKRNNFSLGISLTSQTWFVPALFCKLILPA